MRFFLSLSLLFILLSSCTKTDCKQEFVGGLTDISEIQDSINIGSSIAVKMNATGRDGCSSLKGLEIIENDVNGKNEIWVSSIISSVGCECTMLFPSFETQLNYTANTKGWNIIRFFNQSIADSKIDSFFVR